jgi:integrase
MAAIRQQPKGTRRKPARRPSFDVKRDSVRVHVRFSPQKIGRYWYESWIVEYSFRGQRIRERCSTERKAKTCADAAATKLAHGQMEALELRGADRRIYLAATAHLRPLKIRLDVAAREYADAKKVVKNADLRTVAHFYQKFGRTQIKPITVPELVKEMTTALELDKRGDYHVRDLRTRLGRFAKDFPGQIAEIVTEEIETWLRQLTSLAKGTRRGGKPKGRTRNNYRNAIVELFHYARKHGYLPRDLATEADAVNRVSEADKAENQIFEPDQMDDLLSESPVHLVPSMAIKAFSGVRTEEIFLMEWEHVHFRRGKGYIILPRPVTKKKRRRILPILPNLRKWIAPFEGMEGRICQQWSTPQGVFQAWDRFAAKRSIKAGANRFRNSYISYRVAQTSDPKKTALETGNSAEVIMEDYLELTTSEDAARWFKITPSANRLEALAKHANKLKRAQAGTRID